MLIYPSDISSGGYIQKVSYLGAKNPIWFLGERDILFSSEGTIGKTFTICDKSMKFTTNFHGTIIHPKQESSPLNKSIFLALYLNYLRCSGIFERISVGANGGSFAVGYWNNIIIPNVDDAFMEVLSKLYNSNVPLSPTKFDLSLIKASGIYQLNSFLIHCKTVLNQLCNDIKKNTLQKEEYYKSVLCKGDS